ncbi:MAG: hypothetical protein WBD76_05390 [Methyloceanibacter sp.]
MSTIKISTEDLLPALAGGADSTKAEVVPKRANTRGLFERVLAAELRGSHQLEEQNRNSSPPPTRQEGEVGAPNDLRSYLQQRRASLRAREAAKEPRQEGAPAGPSQGRVGPVLKSIDAVLNHIRLRSAGNAAGAVLVVAGKLEIDATKEAIRIARSLLAGKQRGVLVDLTRGATAVSGRLGLPRAPGFTDLAAGRVGFEDVVHVDDETPLQVIPAGNPTVGTEGRGNGRLTGIFTALAQAYDFIVLHVDRDTAAKIQSPLEGRVGVVVAVLAPGAAANSGALTDLTAFGCPVLRHEQGARERLSRRSGLFGRAAAF